ncbi:MAG: hypothetical protein IJ597_06130, partial [Synergistaceae bacterium]|nr:hypothetical protein [Synergistaceae bacterium]
TGNATSGYSLASEKKVELADTVSNGAFFTDDEGNITDKVPSNGEAVAIAPMTAGIEYTPVVTLAEESQPSGSSSGCNVALGTMTIAVLAFAFFKKR